MTALLVIALFISFYLGTLLGIQFQMARGMKVVVIVAPDRNAENKGEKA